MNIGGWIDLHEFSQKFGISLSTLRRRIRAKSISFKLERGRYWLPDTQEAMSAAPLFSRSFEAQGNEAGEAALNAAQKERLNGLEQENRRLKAQIAELNTLVGVLESELSQKESLKANSRPAEFNA